MHDRRMPGSRTNIDHLAVAPSGVYVIDAKRLKGTIEVRKPRFGEEKLVVAGRDKTKLVIGLERQAEAVRAGLNLIEKQIPVHACFCFIKPAGQSRPNGIPRLSTLRIKEFQLLYPRRLAKRLNQPGELSAEEVDVVAEALVELFPAA
jgi:nuclease-like protein